MAKSALARKDPDTDLYREFIKREGWSMEEARELADYMARGTELNKQIVSIFEFCNSPHYLNALNPDGSSVIYEKVMPHLVELNHGGYDEAVLTGAIGSAKTTIALYTQAYQLYLLSCYDYPHMLFGLDSASEIMIVFQSLTEKAAVNVDYTRFKEIIDRSPYFERYFPYDPNIKSKLVFPNRIVVMPAATSVSGAIGQNVIGGLIDEINFMAVVEKSRKAMAEEGALYDQAKAIYEAIDRRRRSRFMLKGRLPGILCLSSSKRYPGEFTDKKVKEAHVEKERLGKTTIYIYDKRSWDIKPEGTYSGEKFRIFIGDEFRKPRILGDNEKLSKADEKLVDYIPIEYFSKFEGDILGAIRDIAGHSTLARFPFMINSDLVSACFGKRTSILNLEEADFERSKIMFFPKRFTDTKQPRWVHVDLGQVSDAAGVSCGYVKKFVRVKRGDLVEMLPEIHFDFALRVPPPPNGEIMFYKIRELLFKVRAAGLNIMWVSFDSWQSVDSKQLLRQQGFITGDISMDETTLPYDFTKTAFYDGRVFIQQHTTGRKELLSLERDPKTGKIDHPVHIGKDVADSIAGVVYGLTMRREIWLAHQVSFQSFYERVKGAGARDVKTQTATGRRDPRTRLREVN